MATISLTLVLSYLLMLRKADKRQNKVRKVEQYKETTVCSLIDF